MRKSRKSIVITGTVAGVLVGGAAFAYWSTTGGGTGSASTSAGESNLNIVQTSSAADLFPGGPAKAVSGTVTNDSSQSAYVNTITTSIASVTHADGSALSGCNASDYVLTNPTVTVGKDLAQGASSAFSGTTIGFNNKTSNQDACKGAKVNLAFTSN